MYFLVHILLMRTYNSLIFPQNHQIFLIFPPPPLMKWKNIHPCLSLSSHSASTEAPCWNSASWRRYWNPLYWIHPKIISRQFEEAPNIEILSANHLLTVISAPANTGMPNTVVYLGRMEDKLLGIPRGFSWLGTGFRGQTTLDAAFKSF